MTLFKIHHNHFYCLEDKSIWFKTWKRETNKIVPHYLLSEYSISYLQNEFNLNISLFIAHQKSLISDELLTILLN